MRLPLKATAFDSYRIQTMSMNSCLRAPSVRYEYLKQIASSRTFVLEDEGITRYKELTSP